MIVTDTTLLCLALKNLLALIDRGWIPPDDVDVTSWDAACQAYRESFAVEDARAAVARAEGR